MLRLKLPTDPRWAKLVESNIEEILSDHAWAEQKAASNALSVVTNNSEHADLVADMLVIAKEEVEHFQLVHNIIMARGFQLARERKDPYVNELFKFLKKDGSRISAFVDRMLFSALIEARSCERFQGLIRKHQRRGASHLLPRPYGKRSQPLHHLLGLRPQIRHRHQCRKTLARMAKLRSLGY
jgi:tRNA-(ms[2]io[6]A)-hydroxylase